MYYAPETDTVYDAPRKGDPSHVEIASPDGPEFEWHYSFYVFNGETMQWELSTERVAQDVRKRRDEALAACDYLIMPDYPITAEQRAEWETYRQALRDITEQEGFPLDVTWPEKPTM